MKENKFIYSGRLGSMYSIFISNFLLSILTLGIYSFWGRTKVRKYLCSNLMLAEKPVEYTGKGKELFYGFTKVYICIIAVVQLKSFLASLTPEAVQLILKLLERLVLAVFIYLYFAALYMAYRYRLSHTQWNGIRGKRVGSAIAFANKGVIYIIFNLITLGLIKPIFDVNLRRYVINNSYFGNLAFSMDKAANGRELLKINFITWLLAIPSLGISRFWYNAALNNYIYTHSSLGSIRFTSSYTGANLMSLYLCNTLLVLFTFGLATPIALHNNMKFFATNVGVLGEISDVVIDQSDQELDSSGEGVLSVLDNLVGV